MTQDILAVNMAPLELSIKCSMSSLIVHVLTSFEATVLQLILYFCNNLHLDDFRYQKNWQCHGIVAVPLCNTSKPPCISAKIILNPWRTVHKAILHLSLHLKQISLIFNCSSAISKGECVWADSCSIRSQKRCSKKNGQMSFKYILICTHKTRVLNI